MIKVETIPLVDLSLEDFKKCESLNAGSRGQMRSEIRWRYRAKDKNAKVCLVKDEADLLLGWALYFKRPRRQLPESHFYVRVKCRKRGIGRTLMQEVLKENGKIKVCPHDHRSGIFFAEFRTSITPKENYYIKEGVKIRLAKGCSKSTNA